LAQLGFQFPLAQHLEQARMQPHFWQTNQLSPRIFRLLGRRHLKNFLNQNPRKQEIGQHHNPAGLVQAGAAEPFL